MHNVFGFLLFSVMLTGCSSKELYQFGQDYQKSDCIEQAATEAQHVECMEAERKSHQEYEEELKAAGRK